MTTLMGGSRGKLVAVLSFSGIAAAYILHKAARRNKLVPSERDAIFITGCDSGLGYSMTLYCHSKGMTVFAGCLNLQSEGAVNLQTLQNVHVIELDVTDNASIKKAASGISSILSDNPGVGRLLNLGQYEWW